MTQLANANANVVVERLRGWNAQAVSQVIEYRGETTIVVPQDCCGRRPANAGIITDLSFNLLSDATCVDRFPVEPRFELNYQLVSSIRLARVRLRTNVSGEQPVIESLVPVWPGANWLEREIFDLFGIRFEGHPDLRRILLPEEFEGFPLRRDFPVEGKR